MLYEFLINERTSILAASKLEAQRNLHVKHDSRLLDEGLPLFFDRLIDILRTNRSIDLEPSQAPIAITKRRTASAAAKGHGREYSKLGYPIGEVVHSYGSICQAITGAATREDIHITSDEFRQLNYSLDTAVAEAVTEFQDQQRAEVSSDEVERLGFLAHELRNSLMAAAVSLELIESGDVGVKSETSKVLRKSLERMKELIDTSLTEVRLRLDPVPILKKMLLSEIIGDVEVTASRQAREKYLNFVVENPGDVIVEIDQQLMLSALSNLVQNAIKFTHRDGTIKVLTRKEGNYVTIDVMDECGGLDDSKIEELFVPFTKVNKDKSGLGLGLTISRRAAELNNGTLTARNVPGKGCIFSLELPISQEH